jgi:hypothetical protein
MSVLTANDELRRLEQQNMAIIRNPQSSFSEKQAALQELRTHFLDIYNKLESAGIEFQIHLTDVALRDPSHVSDDSGNVIRLRQQLQTIRQEADANKRKQDLDDLVNNNVIPLTSMALLSHTNELPVYTNNIVTYDGVTYVVKNIVRDPTNLVNTHYLTVSPLDSNGLLLPSVYTIPHSLSYAHVTPNAITWSDGKTCTSSGGDFTWKTGCREMGLSKKDCRDLAATKGDGKMGLCRALLRYRT